MGSLLISYIIFDIILNDKSNNCLNLGTRYT